MKFAVSDKTRNIVFFILTTFIIICLFVVNNIGNEQDKVYAEESNKFKYAVQLLSENKVSEAEPLLKDLVEKHPENYEISWRYATTQSLLQNFEEAKALFQHAQDLNLTLVKDGTFLAQYGEVLYNLGEFDKAKVYLEESLKFNSNEQINKAVNTLLENIKQKDQR